MFGRTIAPLVAVIGIVAASSSSAMAQTFPAPFSYQGQLSSSGAPVNTPTDFIFRIFDLAVGGTQISTTAQLNAVAVTNGNFAVEVPFGVVLGEDAPWYGKYLQIEVRNPAGSGSFVTLGSRQKITATPYSLATRGFSHSHIDTYMGLNGPFTPWDDLTIYGSSATGNSGTSVRLKSFFNPDWRVASGTDEFYVSTVQANSNTQTKRVVIQSSSGNVGINQATPTQKLDVVGNAIVNGTLMVGGPGSPEVQLLGAGGGPRAVMSRSLSNANRGRMFILDETFTIKAGMDFFGAGTTATLFADVKSFRTPNPDDSGTDIWYASLEGPEAAMYVRGTATLVNGQATIELPPHFKALATTDSLTVQLTPLSADSRGLAVCSKDLSGIDVRELTNGTGTYAFDWEVKAVRRDVTDFEVIRPWDIDRPEIKGVTAQQQWEARLADIERRERRIAELEAAKGLAQQPTPAKQILAAGLKTD